MFLFKSLFEENYEVITADSGEEGLKKLGDKAGDVDVVISDMRMPGMNGVEFIKEANSRFKHIVYFILTGYNYNDEIDEAVNARLVQRFFSKPFDFSEISSAIQETCS